MDIKALQLVSRFALPPNSLGYCGRNSAPEKFKKCAIFGNCSGVEEEINNFIVLYPYLKTLSQITKLPTCSYKIVEAYWLGNDVLKGVKQAHYKLLLNNFKIQNVPNWLVGELKKKKPNSFIPTHLFQVLHVGVGRASGAVPYNLETINHCIISWGQVKKITTNKLTVSLNTLKEEGGRFKLTTAAKAVPYNRKFLGEVNSVDTVAVHWNQVVKILTDEERENLSFWTHEVLKTIQTK